MLFQLVQAVQEAPHGGAVAALIVGALMVLFAALWPMIKRNS